MSSLRTCSVPGDWQGLDRSLVAEAFQAGSIIVVDELAEEGVAIGVAGEGAASAAAFVLATDGFGDAAVEAFDQAVGLRMIGPGQTMVDAALLAETSKGWLPEGLPAGLFFMSTAKRSVNSAPLSVRMVWTCVREVGEEALEEGGCRLAIPARMDLDIDVAGGAVDRDKGIALVALQGRQVLQVDVDEANPGRLEDASLWLGRFGACADAVALQATMDGAARQLCVDASPHHLDDVVERQLQRCPQLADQPFFERRQADLQGLWRMRAGRPRCCGRASDGSWSR